MASRAVKRVIKTTMRAGGTRGEGKGVVNNLRHGTNLSPKAQIRRSVKIAKSEGLKPVRIQKLKAAEKKIASRAAARQAGSIGAKPVARPGAGAGGPRRLPAVKPTSRKQKPGAPKQLGFKPTK